MDCHQLDSQLYEDYKKIGKTIKYGTSGFRSLASHMPYISYRCGIFVAYLNRTNPNKSLGIVVSASHNKIQDNGLKISNFNGNMLQKQYESVIQAFVEEQCLKKAVEDLEKYLQSRNEPCYTKPVTICIGGDTRPTTRNLLDLLKKAIESQGGKALDFGEVTTPQLHFYVHYLNNHDVMKKTVQDIKPVYWEYFSKLYQNCCQYLSSPKKTRIIDCANGVGAITFPYFTVEPYLRCIMINNDHPQLLNEKCGADHVNSLKQFPLNYHSENAQHVSFDGDADRIVLFYNNNNHLQLIDGDRIAILLAVFFSKLLRQVRQATERINQMDNIHIALDFDWKLGIAQTYYVNSAATEFLQKNYNLKTIFSATGVKHLHQKVEHYDIGIYFQPNGHGTALIGSKIDKLNVLLSMQDSIIQPLQHKEQVKEYFNLLKFFKNACGLANPGVGDAITDLLLIEVALDYLTFDYKALLGLYTDYASRTTKIKVNNKSALKVTPVEDKVVKPEGLQQLIEETYKKYGGYKAFVRASGTEDVLRLHVEAKDIETIEKIQKDINEIIKNCKELQ